MSVQAAFTGSVTRPAEVLTDDGGRPFIYFVTVVDGARLEDEAATQIRVACHGDELLESAHNA